MIECKDRLLRDGLKINLPESGYGINPDVVELGLSLGIEFNIPEGGQFLSLGHIVEYEDEDHRCVDWEHISKHERFRKMGQETISSTVNYMSSWIEILLDRPYVRATVGQWLLENIENMRINPGLILSSKTINTFVSYPSLLWSLFPKQAKMVMDIDLSIPLANTLQMKGFDLSSRSGEQEGVFLAYFSRRDLERAKALEAISVERCHAFIEWAQQEKKVDCLDFLSKKLVIEFKEDSDEKLQTKIRGVLCSAVEQRSALDNLNTGI